VVAVVMMVGVVVRAMVMVGLVAAKGADYVFPLSSSYAMRFCRSLALRITKLFWVFAQFLVLSWQQATRATAGQAHAPV
jgi:hypothetical protein